MKKVLAIKGHKERFSEVIEILESLGGKILPTTREMVLMGFLKEIESII